MKATRIFEATLRYDDYPGDANQGIVCCGLSHLERQGFKEGDRVVCAVSIEKVESPANNGHERG